MNKKLKINIDFLKCLKIILFFLFNQSILDLQKMLIKSMNISQLFMNVQQFKQLLKRQNAKVKAGKEQELMDSVIKYGLESPQVQTLISTVSPKAKINQLKTVLKMIQSLYKRDILSIINNLLSTYVGVMMMDPEDILELILFTSKNDQLSFQKLTSEYGLQIQFPNECLKLKENISQICSLLKKQSSNQKWDKLVQIIKQASRKLSIEYKLYHGDRIRTFQNFKMLANKNRIFFNKQKCEDLFWRIKIFGLTSENKNSIVETTYPKFVQKLQKLVLQIQVRDHLFYQKHITPLINQLIQPYFLKPLVALNFLESYISQRFQQWKQIMKQNKLNMQELTVNICKPLKQLLNEIKPQFKGKQKQKMIKYVQKYIAQSLNHIQEANQFDSNSKQKLKKFKYALIEMGIPQIDLYEMVTKYYENDHNRVKQIIEDNFIEEEEFSQAQKFKAFLDTLICLIKNQDQKIKKIKLIQYFLKFQKQEQMNDISLIFGENQLNASVIMNQCQSIDQILNAFDCKNEETETKKTEDKKKSNQIIQYEMMEQQMGASNKQKNNKKFKNKSKQLNKKEQQYFEQPEINDYKLKQTKPEQQYDELDETYINKMQLCSYDQQNIMKRNSSQQDKTKDYLMKDINSKSSSIRKQQNQSNQNIFNQINNLEHQQVKQTQQIIVSPNIFEPQKQSPITYKFIQFLIAVYSKNKIDGLKLFKKQQSKYKELQITSKQFSFNNINIHLIGCSLSKSLIDKYHLQIYSTIKNNKSIRKQYFQNQSFQGTSIKIINHPPNIQINHKNTINYIVLMSIPFIFRFILLKNKKQINQVDILAWLNTIFNAYQLENEEDKEVFQKIYFQKEDLPLMSKYFLYFFYAIYRKKAAIKYQQYEIQKKIIFNQQQYIGIYFPERFKKCNQIQQFYLKIHLLYCLNKKFHIQIFKRIVLKILGQFPQQQIGSIFFLIKNKNPKAFYYINDDILQQFRRNNFLDALQFFKIKASYLTQLFQRKQASQKGKQIIKFVSNLIQISQLRPIQSNLSINSEQMQSIIFQTNFMVFSKMIVNSIQDLTQFYLKSKKLRAISHNKINFLVSKIKQNIDNKMNEIINKKFGEVFLSMLCSPIDETQVNLLQNYFKISTIPNYQMKQCILLVVNGNYEKQIYERFYHLIQIFTKQNKQAFKYEINSIFQLIDQLITKNQQNIQIVNFLIQLFKLFKSKIDILDCQNNWIQVNKYKLQTSLNVCFNLTNKILKQFLIEAIFTILKQKIVNCSTSFIFELFNQILSKSTQKNNQKKIFFNNYFFNFFTLNPKQLEQSIWNFIKINPINLIEIKRKYPNQFDNAFSNIIEMIKKQKYYSSQLNQIQIQKIKNANVSQQLKELIQVEKNKLKRHQLNLKYVMDVLKVKQTIFQSQIAEILQSQDNLKTLKLFQAYDIKGKLSSLLQRGSQIYYLKQNNLLKWEQINSIENLVEQQLIFKQLITKFIGKFQKKQLTYSQFKMHFMYPNLKEIIDIYCKNKQSQRLIIEISCKLNQKQISQIQQYANAVNFIMELLQQKNAFFNYSQFKELVIKLKNKNEDINIFKSFQILKQIQLILINAFGINNSFEQSNNFSTVVLQYEQIKVVKQIFKAKNIFDLIKRKEINLNSINDLKDYINDLENSIFRMELIKEFQNVVVIWGIIKKSKNLKNVLNGIHNLLEKGVQLLNSIKNCCINYRLIQQKVQQSLNRQTCFKNQLSDILDNSIFQITINVEIVVKIIRKKQVNQNKQINQTEKISQQQKYQFINYKTLNQFKDKSKLLISDIAKENEMMFENNQSNNNTIQIFKKYEQFFGIVENIYQNVTKLANYGFNPEQMACIIQIKNSDFDKLKEQQKQLQKQSNDWVTGIKELYSQSYLLTHFIGLELSKFINSCGNLIYNPCLQNILNLTQKKFKQKLQQKQFVKRMKDSKINYPLQRIKNIIKIFSSIESSFIGSQIDSSNHQLSNQQSNSCIGDFQSELKSILLLTCSSKQIYFCLFQNKHNNIAHSSQIFYCLESTTSQQLQFFIYRAIICSTKTHYIIGAHNLQDQIKIIFCDFLYSISKQNGFKKAQLCFVSDTISDKLYGFLSNLKLFKSKKKQLSQKQSDQKMKKMMKILPQTLIISSKRAGLGKTFTIQQIAKQQKKTLRYFPVCGNIKFENLAKRLKQMNITKNESLLIQIGHVQNKKKLQVFLSQIILFRCFYFKQYIYIPLQTPIYIEIQNIIKNEKEDSYHILNILMANKRNIFIKEFELSKIYIDPSNQNDKFVFTYLNLLNQPHWINKNEYKYTKVQLLQFQKKKIHTKKLTYMQQKGMLKLPNDVQNLIKKYFIDWFANKKIQPTYRIFKFFKDMLFKAFKTFSDSPYFEIQNFTGLYRIDRIIEISKARQNFLLICIQNTLDFLQQTFTSNNFEDNNLNLTNLHQKIRKLSIIIIPSDNYSNYEFIYLNDQAVKLPLKSLCLAQNQLYWEKILNIKKVQQIHQIFRATALNNLEQKQQQEKFFSILMGLSGNRKFCGTLVQIKDRIKQLSKYKITLDNFFKMCLIILRSQSFVPCVIMGESGVGKTALIEFLVKVVYQQYFFVYNVHAGIHQQKIEEWVKQFSQKAKNIEQNKRIWVFFDEFNTTDELDYIKQIIVDRKFLGINLPKNIMFLTACNPYRKRQQIKNKIKAGIKKYQQIKSTQLIFKVKPPSLSLVQLMWDYIQLGETQNKVYIKKILQNIVYIKKQLLIEAISIAHEDFKKRVEISSVSLRDVSRFKEIYEWFMKYQMKNYSGNITFQSKQFKDSSEKSVILSFSFCYVLRISDKNDKKKFVDMIQKIMGYSKGYTQMILQNQQRQYINKFKIYEQKIACNSAIKQNIFTSLVCIMNKIPILIIGNPGTSKSISIKMLASNLRGLNSESQFCKHFPQVNMLYFQGSQSSTSQGVEYIFNKAQKKHMEQKKLNYQILNCIEFDQAGLAEKSVHNPLKVLHSKLDTNQKDIAFIGISNFSLDAAKMSRFLVISRSNPTEEQTKDTAIKIYQCYFENNSLYIGTFKILGQNYFNFINQWNSNPNNRQNFFGLRDFYSYIKYVCREIKQNDISSQQIDKIIARSIQINFDGQTDSLKLFRTIASVNHIPDEISPIELVRKNLQMNDSRCLMLIIKGDALIPIINENIVVNGKNRKIISIHGSTFSEDQQSQQYNLEVTSSIISHISRGSILTFKDINNSIQTSLYDLFNKSFTQIGDKKYCRISVGANSNPKCFVHSNFNAIVYIDQQKLKEQDLPFLNRFQKHYLNLRSVINKQQKTIFDQITGWLKNILSFRTENMTLKRQNFILNSCDESIVTLILKHRRSQKMIQQIKIDLLKNRTTDFIIAMKEQKQIYTHSELQKYIQKIPSLIESKQDLIVFTYDQLSDIIQDNNIFKIKKYIIRLSQIKDQRNLRKLLKKAFDSKQTEGVQIIVDYQHHYMHLNFVLFLSKEIKLQMNSNKQIIIIIQLHRFSLLQLNIDFINISYLHKFQQYFAESLQSLEQIQKLLDCQTCWQLFEQLKLKQSFDAHFVDTLKLIQFKCQYQINQKLKQRYFQECIQVSNDQYFQLQNLLIIKEYLSKEKINFHYIQTNQEDLRSSSNISEALIKYIGDIVKQIIFYSLRMTIEGGFLFYFKNNSTNFQSINVFQYIDEFYKKQQQKLKSFFRLQYQQQCAILKKNISKIKSLSKFTKIPVNNIIKIKQQITLFPLIYKDFNYLLADKQNLKQEQLEQLAQKISFKQQQQNVDYEVQMQKCESFITSKLQVCSHIFFVDKWTEDLEKIYLFDVLTFFLKSSKFNSHQICAFMDVLQKNFTQFNLHLKLIMLTGKKKLVLYIFQLLSIYFSHQSPNKLILSFGQIKLKNIGKALIEYMKLLFTTGVKMVQLEETTIKSFSNVTEYVSFFRSIFIKMLDIVNNFREQGLTFQFEFTMINKLLEMFEKLNKTPDELIRQFVKERSNEHSLLYNIQMFCDKLLKKEQNNEKIEVLLNYLSLNIFYNWLNMIDDNQDQNHPYSNQRDICITNFIQKCNQFCFFANNATYFLQLLLSDLEDLESIKQMQSYFSQQFDEKCNLQETNYIEFTNNFTVALSNYIATKIQIIFQEDQQNQNSSKISKYVYIAKTYQETFISIINNTEKENQFYKLFKIEFIKKYCLCYLELLRTNQQNQLLIRIDRLLSKQNIIIQIQHAKIYMLKHLYSKFSYQQLYKFFIEVKRCNWIINLFQFFEQNQIENVIPPTNLPEDHKIYSLIKQLQDSKFANTAIFNQLINQSIQTYLGTYEMLNYFMLTFYTNSCPQNNINILKGQIKYCKEFYNINNWVIKQLLIKYMDHKISEKIQFKLGTTTNQQFMGQLPLLNYLNIIVSCNKKKNCPLQEMFFDARGYIFQNYSNYLNSRFLIGSMQNPFLSRLEFIYKRHLQGFTTNFYKKCSPTCDYLLPVKEQSQNMKSKLVNINSIKNCPLCNKTINNQRDQNSNIKFQELISLKTEFSNKKSISLTKQEQTKTYELVGYQNGNQIEELKKKLQIKKHYLRVTSEQLERESQFIHHKLLQTIINFVWYFLAENKIIREDSLLKIFNYNTQDSKAFLLDASHFYYQAVNESINFRKENEINFRNENDNIIWHLGFGKKLINFIINYDEKNKHTLLNSSKRDQFQCLFEQLIFPYTQVQKERLILQTRKMKTVSKVDIIRERGNFEQHLHQYPLLRLFKLINIEYYPSYQNMKKQYNQKLSKCYPILHYLMNNQIIENKLKWFKNIYAFISKLWKLFNLKLTQEEGKMGLNEAVLSNVAQNEKLKVQQEINQFIKSWNQLFQLNQKNNAQNYLKKMKKISNKSSLKLFLLERGLDQNNENCMVELIRVTAIEYNDICRIIENHVKTAYSQQQSAEIFSCIPLNPTLIDKNSKILNFPTQIIQQKIHKYSSYSVEYGISNPFYAFDHIQSMIAKQFYGCKYLIVDPQKFCYINYLNEQTHFITQFRKDQNQKLLDQNNDLKTKITNYINAKRNNISEFYKITQQIKNSLQKIIVFFKYYKNNHKYDQMPLMKFVKEKKIIGTSKLLEEQPMKSLPLCYIINLYEMIEYLSYQKLDTLLQNQYRQLSIPLESEQKIALNTMIKQMKSQPRHSSIPYYLDFKTALYRLVGRKILHLNNFKLKISELIYAQYYWPKNVKIDPFKDKNSGFNKLMEKLTISKIGNILRIVGKENQNIAQTISLGQSIDPNIKKAQNLRNKQKKNDKFYE